MLRVLIPFVLLSLPASLLAQMPEAPAGHEGAVVSYSEDSVTLKVKDGSILSVAMTPGWTVSVGRAVSAETIQSGSFVASANTNIDANTGRSQELRILEPGYRPEQGTHPMTRDPNGSMTHGTVSGITQSASGREIDVTYPGGSRHLIVPNDVPVIAFDPRDRSSIKPGVMVSAVTRKGTDGVPRAGRLVLLNK